MEDYFCIPKNIQAAKLYIEYLSRKFRNVNISFSNEDYDLYETFPIQDFGKRFGINIIPSIMFNSRDGFTLVVFNPSNRALSVLEDVKIERTNRIINILYGLSDKFSIHISPNDLIKKIDRDDITDIYLASDQDIIDLIIELGYCDNFLEAGRFFNIVNLPRLLPTYNKLINRLSYEEDLYIANPDPNKIDNIGNIKGFILNYKTININKIKDLCLYNKDIKFGSGKLIV